MEYRYSGHSVYYTQYHVVWVTKFRRKVLNPGFAKYADTKIREIVERIEGVEIGELNIQTDHVHILLLIPPKYAVAKVVEIIKSNSTKLVRQKFPWLDKPYFNTSSLWSVGYFASTVGTNEEVIRKYVRYQQNQDSGQAKLEFGSQVPRH